MRVGADVTVACRVFNQNGIGQDVTIPIHVETGHTYKVTIVAESDDSCNDVNGSINVTLGGNILYQGAVFASASSDEEGCGVAHVEEEVTVTVEGDGNLTVNYDLLWNAEWRVIAYRNLPQFLDMSSDLVLVIYWTLLCSALGAIFLAWSALEHRRAHPSSDQSNHELEKG